MESKLLSFNVHVMSERSGAARAHVLYAQRRVAELSRVLCFASPVSSWPDEEQAKTGEITGGITGKRTGEKACFTMLNG